MTSLDLIKTLREKTGASLQACKKALDETQGDEQAAIDLLRKKGEAKMADRADRMTTEGVVAVATDSQQGVILALGCETDFVAKSPDFVQAAQTLAETLLKNGDDHDTSTMIQDLNLKMGEKVAIAGLRRLEGDHLGTYIHSNQKMGGLVALKGGTEELAKDVAMHVVAMNPWTTTPQETDETKLAKEKEIWAEEVKKEGKPAEIVEKILMGKEKKFREEHALLTQPFVKNPDQTVQALLNGAEVKGFARMEC